jgi:hypothetical protein
MVELREAIKPILAEHDKRRSRKAFLLGILASSPAWLLAVVQLKDMVAPKAPYVVGTAVYTEFDLPKPFWKSVDAIEDRLGKADKTFSRLGDDAPSTWNWLSRQLKVAIKNEGELEATKAAIALEGSGFAIIERANGDKEEVNFTNELKLGTLPLDSEVTISVWLRSYYSSDNVSIRYESGRAQIEISDPTFQYVRPSLLKIIAFVASPFVILFVVAAVYSWGEVAGRRNQLNEARALRELAASQGAPDELTTQSLPDSV